MKVTEIAKTAGTKISNVAGRAGLKLRKHSPEILMVVGTVSVVGGVILACKATLKAEEVLDRHNDEMGEVNAAAEMAVEDEYTDTDIKRDKVVVYAHTVGRYMQLYAPAVGLTVFGIGCFMGAYGIMRKRNLALMAAYDGLQRTLSDYRERVREKLGGVEEEKLYQGLGDEVENDQGDRLPVVGDGYTPSVYARFFDELSTQWTRNPELNKMNLCQWQNWANDLLNARGHLFLNEVYDMLGLQRSKAGAVVGWVKHGSGDGYVDFGMFNVNRAKSRDFVNGYEPSILLDFNVDGVIYDLI